MSVIPPDALSRRFRHHPPTTEHVIDLHEQARRQCLDLAEWLNENLPEAAPEAEKALDAVDDACKHANAAIARHGNTAGPR